LAPAIKIDGNMVFPQRQEIIKISLYSAFFVAGVIAREVDCHPLSNVEKLPHNQVVLRHPPGALRPSAGKDLACRSDKRQNVRSDVDI
jgi:hypothetical protein